MKLIDEKMSNCKKCQQPLEGNYCSHCGNPAALKRIDGHYIIHEIQHVLHFEKGFLYTIKELLIRPGITMRTYIKEDRNRLVKPILFVIVTSLIYTLINHFFHIEDGYMTYKGEENPVSKIMEWVQEHYGYANIIMGACSAFWTKVFFKKYGYNFFEILIVICFTMGIGMLLFSLSGVIEAITKIHFMQFFAIISTLYSTWAVGLFFENKIKNYIKALLAYFLGMITFTLGIVIVSFIWMIIEKSLTH